MHRIPGLLFRGVACKIAAPRAAWTLSHHPISQIYPNVYPKPTPNHPYIFPKTPPIYPKNIGRRQETLPIYTNPTPHTTSINARGGCAALNPLSHQSTKNALRKR